MIELIFRQTACTRGDETAPYDVFLTQECTVEEFVTSVLDRNEWGTINIKGCGRIEYKQDKIISTTLTNGEMPYLIKSVHATGGWSRMDYYLEIKTQYL